jgi:hypothetical protein
LPIAALTAWMALVELSLFAIQLAAANGANVIITSSSDDKITRAVSLWDQPAK